MGSTDFPSAMRSSTVTNKASSVIKKQSVYNDKSEHMLSPISQKALSEESYLAEEEEVLYDPAATNPIESFNKQ